MKKYWVYAVGSAIVDYEYTLSQNQSLPGNIEKGTTILLTHEQEKALTNTLSELTANKSCGGTGANTLSVISGLGKKVFYSCLVADDDDGNFYHNDLQRNHIESNLDFQTKISGKTGKSIILIKENDRTLFSRLGVNAELSPANLIEEKLAESEYVFIETFLANSPSSKFTALAAIKLARQYHCKLAITLSTCKLPGFSLQHLYDFVNAADKFDLLFCNKLEATYFCETNDLQQIIEKLKSFADKFVITCGGDDTIIFDGKNCLTIPAYPTNAVNTTGAGDIFAGAFLYKVISTNDYYEAAKFANLAASFVIQKQGARLDENDFEKLLKSEAIKQLKILRKKSKIGDVISPIAKEWDDEG